MILSFYFIEIAYKFSRWCLEKQCFLFFSFFSPLFWCLIRSCFELQRTVESWLRKEREEERKRRKETKANGLSGYEKRAEGSRVTGDPARSVVRAMNNGWAAGRLHSTIAGEENFFYSSNSVLRQ